MGKLGLFTALVLFASLAVGTFVFLSSRPSGGKGEAAGFDLSAVEEKPEVVGTRAEIQASPNPTIGENSEQPVPDPAAAPRAYSRTARPTGASASSAPSDGESPADERQREKEFLQKHGAALASYHGQLGKITMSHFRKNRVVREIDATFAGMSRYMAVKKRFDKDRDPFQFARDAISLPEVRAEIKRRAADPEVWKAAIGMTLEALKNPPPPALYEEAKRFVVGDDKVASFVTEFTATASNNVGAIAQGIPPGADITPLTKLASEVSPTMPALPDAKKR